MLFLLLLLVGETSPWLFAQAFLVQSVGRSLPTSTAFGSVLDHAALYHYQHDLVGCIGGHFASKQFKKRKYHRCRIPVHSSMQDDLHGENSFQAVAKTILKEDAKSTNIELANRGQKFVSHHRRFDYMHVQNSLDEMHVVDDDREDCYVTRNGSLWKSISMSQNKKDNQMYEFLQALLGGNETETMLMLQQMENVFQRYSHVQHANDDHDTYLDRVVKDDRLTIETTSGVDLLDLTIQRVAQRNLGHNIQVKHYWKGNVYVTEAFLYETPTRDNVSTVTTCKDARSFYTMERKLQYLPLDDDDNDDDYYFRDKGDVQIMVVNSTLCLDVLWEDESHGKTKDGSNVISCSQVFVKAGWDGCSGEEYATRTGRNILGCHVERVSGCVANVKVRTLLIPMERDSLGSYQVLLDGESDAVLSRGLLSVLRQSLSSMSAQSVLNIDPRTVADQLGLRHVLSVGRNDGLASMVTVIQKQIRNLLGMETLQERLEDDSMSEKIASNPVGSNPGASQGSSTTVAMLLSGGVDSSVALNLLVRQGYNVTAFYLKIWLEDELAHLGQCPWEDDYRVCTQVCQQAGVPLEAISLQNEYKDKVISYTIHEAQKGRTPNPDIMCNSRVKFGCFYDAISQRNFDYVATGHYAQLQEIVHAHSNGRIERKLLRAPDPIKDQSYFLAALTQEQLSRVLFPIGQYEKSRVRELAHEFDLPNKNRPDSQGLCFLGKVKFDEFLSEYLGTEPGDIVDAETQEVIGRHNGIWYHTVGQRKGIGKVLYPSATSRGPWYVVAKDTSRRLIIASNQYDGEKFESTRREFFVEDIRWITENPPSSLDLERGVRLSMKIRHGPTIVSGTLLQTSNHNAQGSEATEHDSYKIVLDKKDGGLAPGQFVVFYNGMECLGSAVISEKHWLAFFQSESMMKNKTVAFEIN